MRSNEDMPLPLGAVLDEKYRVDRVIGRGGMGIVYQGTHLALERQVAIKVMRPSLSIDEDAVARFDREARATSALASKHVTKIHDVGRSEGGHPYFVMELLTGTTLASRVARGGPLPPEQVVGIALDIIDALREAHAAGIIHRDLKPANVFLGDIAKVLDFGIAKVDSGIDGGITATGATLGTPEFMAPEQLDTKRGVTPKSDVWSLGVTMYYALTVKTPFEADSFYDLSIKVYAHEPTPITKHRADLPPAIVAVIAGCLQKDAKKRFSLEDVATRLADLPREALEVAPASATIETPAAPSPVTKDATPVVPVEGAVAPPPTVVAHPHTLVMPPLAALPEPAPAAPSARPAPTGSGLLFLVAGALALVLAVAFLYVKSRPPAPELELSSVPSAADFPAAVAEEPPAPATPPAPAGSAGTTAAVKNPPVHTAPRRRPVAAPPKSSNGALTHER